MCRFRLACAVGAIWLGAILCDPAHGAVLYSQDFESLNDGDAVSSLPGWVDVLPTTRVKNTAEIGKAIDPRGQSAATFGGPDVETLGVAPSAGDGVWTFGFDATVFATTGNTFEMNIFGTGGSSYRYAVLKNTDNNNWYYQIYNDGGGSDVTGNVNDGGGSGTHTTTIEFVVDVDNDQAFFRIGGTESAKADAYPLAGIFYGIPYKNFDLYLPMPSSGMLLDNFRITNSAATAVPGDFDGDGDVDGADFVAWQTHFPTASGATLATGDADGDGDVDGADFVVWQTHFPTTPSSGAVSAVPEPSSVIVTALGVFGLVGAAGARVYRTARR